MVLFEILLASMYRMNALNHLVDHLFTDLVYTKLILVHSLESIHHPYGCDGHKSIHDIVNPI